jgi:essential nuclear protein 1
MGRKRRERVEYHKQSLGEQIENPETYGVRTQPRPEKKHRHSGAGSEDEEEQVPGALSNRILEVAREQQEEVAAEGEQDNEGFAGGAREALAAAMQGLAGAASDSDEEYQGDDFSDPGSAGWEEEYEAELNGQDEAALEAFMNPTAKGQKQKTLTDVIMEKIREKQAAAGLSAVPRYVFVDFVFFQ